MKIKTFSKKFLVGALLLAFAGCETFDLDQTENPSTLPQSYNDPIQAFNYIQLQLPDFVNSANSFTQRVTRQMAMTGGRTYDNAFQPELFDNNWIIGYRILNTVKQMEAKALADQQYRVFGASKVIRCYVLMTLVDLYGDVPYSEALMGNANLTPRYDASEDVYAGVYGELNDAIAYLQNTAATNEDLAQDIMFGTGEVAAPDADAWIRVANSLKLKMLHTARLTGIQGYDTASEVNALIAGGQLIDSATEDFAFRYGTEREVPNSRHPDYNNDYEFGGGSYLGNYFMWAVSREKAEPTGGSYPYFDIRTQYYFYRQAANSTDTPQNLPCEYFASPEHYGNVIYASFYIPDAVEAAYCTTDLGGDGTSFWGRDHGDDSGIPQDDETRSAHGLYPAGGKFDYTASPVANNQGVDGALGEGIMPILLSSFVHFMKAELALTVPGVTGNPAAELEAGMRASFEKVTTAMPQQEREPSQSVIDSKVTTYVNFVMTRFNAASAADKLNILVKEFYIASWGNGIEPYNNYRRTGYPDNMQPTLEPEPGQYFYTALYPAIGVNNNPNAPANVRTRKVFWEETAGLDLH
ncbi:SusD/RagB family nutrient-binding outer membrane lipoprotein [Flavobacterium caeni]|uniref:Susd and RagB outer membrane lipoprotein n=1 Tax=Flavobacterium caeni TaxID=490189 RepID=A0A1G5J2W4_9FLAO|nr:SusD/RagB family nutrient-binding outer membrane lipoprotein [Flavobacterium caeni]SCY82673.1 Susd and RagB outer membrane lipoprotein [Flavobacterium caeni]